MNLRLTKEVERVLEAQAEENGPLRTKRSTRAILDRRARLSREKDVRALACAAIKNYWPLLGRLAQ
jgi:hypothetical protein